MTSPKPSSKRETDRFPSWFRPHDSIRTKRLAFWLLVWNSMALLDAIAFTFTPEANLNTYYGEGTWCAVTLAQTRMLANCQLGLAAVIALLAFTAEEKILKTMFQLLIVITLGAFRGVYLGVSEGTIIPPWKTWWASLLSLPPLLFLCYFAFIF